MDKQSILDRDKTLWIATLSDGSEVWQDIPKEDDPEYSTWEEFRSLSPKIVGLKIKFRSHIEELPPNADGYYFRKSIIADLPGENVHCYVAGYIQNNVLYKIWYRIPEIIEWHRDEVKNWDSSDKGIIYVSET